MLSICDLSNRRRYNTELMGAIRGLSEALKNNKFKGLGLTFSSGNNLFEQKIKPSIMVYALTNSPAYTKENSNYKSTIPDLKAIYSIEEINEEWWKGNGILESTLATDNYLNLTNRFENVRFEDEYQTKTREKCGDSLPKNEDAKHYAMPSLSGRIRNYELDLDYYVRISATHKQQWLIAAKINFTTDKLNNYENPMTKIIKFVPIKLDGADGLVYQYLPSKYLLIGRKTDKKEKNVHKEKAFVYTYSAMYKEEALGLAAYLRHNTIHKKLTEHSTSVLFSYSNLNKLKVPTYGALMKHGKSIWGGMETITPNIFNGHYGQCSEDLMKRLCNDGSNNDVIQLFDNVYEDQIQIKQEEEEKQSIIQSNNNPGFVPYQRLGDFSKVSKIHKKPENKKIEKFNEKQYKIESKISNSVI